MAPTVNTTLVLCLLVAAAVFFSCTSAAPFRPTKKRQLDGTQAATNSLHLGLAVGIKLANYSLAKNLTNQPNITDTLASKVAITCELHAANNNLDILSNSSDDLLLKATASTIEKQACEWLEYEVGSDVFPMNCSGTTETIKQDFDNLCEMWEYISTTRSLLLEIESSATVSEATPEQLNQWICVHGLESDALVQSSNLFDTSCNSSQ